MSLPIRLSKDSREPMYHQIENQLKALIAGGQLPAQSSLPSIRTLSKELEVSVITTRRAYQNLEALGFIKTIQGKGTFVAEITRDNRDAVKKETIHTTFEEAIDLAKQYDYSIEQIEQLFKNVLKASDKGELK